MTVSWPQLYLQANMIILAGYGLLEFFRPRLRPRQGLQLSYGIASFFVVLPLIAWCLPRAHRFFPDIQVGSEGFPAHVSVQVHDSAQRLQALWNHLPAASLLDGSESIAPGITLGLITLGLVFFLVRLVKELRSLSVLQQGGFTFRKVGRVSLLTSEEISVPFSFWNRRAYVALQKA